MGSLERSERLNIRDILINETIRVKVEEELFQNVVEINRYMKPQE